MKKYRITHKLNILKNQHRYYIKNKKKLRKLSKYYYLKSRDKILRRHKIYKRKNKQSILQNYYNKRNSNAMFKLLCNLRHRINMVLKGNPKLSTTLNLVGCSIEKLKQHLEKQFTKGMNFNNYGKWHVDHIRPCAKFDLSKSSEQRKCFHYTNLQPLWAKDNLKKGKR